MDNCVTPSVAPLINQLYASVTNDFKMRGTSSSNLMSHFSFKAKPARAKLLMILMINRF
jgi:hypothetical protein